MRLLIMPAKSYGATAAIADRPLSNAAIINFRHLIAEQGYLYLKQLPDNFDHLALAQKLGNLISRQFNDNCAVSIEVAASSGDSASTTSEVQPHSEGNESIDSLAHYQCLWCVRPPHSSGGQTVLADGYAFINSLSAAEQAYIRQNQFEFVTSTGQTVLHPLYDIESYSKPIFRFDFSRLRGDPDSKLDHITQRFLNFFNQHQITIDWAKNDFLIWDNFRMVHVRSPDQDSNCELKRVYLKMPMRERAHPPASSTFVR